MIWLRRACLLLLFANAGLLLWSRWAPEDIAYNMPMTEPGTPGLILHQEFQQLERGTQRLQAKACYRIGPFAAEADMRRAWQSLEYIALDMQMRRREGVAAAGYRLDVPASANRSDAELLRESLLSAGIRQPRIQADNAILVGRYAGLAEAQSQQRVLQQLGIEARLQGLESGRSEWWIDATIVNQGGFTQWQAEQSPRVPAVPCA